MLYLGKEPATSRHTCPSPLLGSARLTREPSRAVSARPSPRPSAFSAPSTCTRSRANADHRGGPLPTRPRSLAACRPARRRSRIRFHSNAARAARTPNRRRPAGVVVSLVSVDDAKPIPRSFTAVTVSIRCDVDPPWRSRLQTPSVSAGVSCSSTAVSCGRSVRPRGAWSVKARSTPAERRWSCCGVGSCSRVGIRMYPIRNSARAPSVIARPYRDLSRTPLATPRSPTDLRRPSRGASCPTAAMSWAQMRESQVDLDLDACDRLARRAPARAVE